MQPSLAAGCLALHTTLAFEGLSRMSSLGQKRFRGLPRRGHGNVLKRASERGESGHARESAALDGLNPGSKLYARSRGRAGYYYYYYYFKHAYFRADLPAEK